MGASERGLRRENQPKPETHGSRRFGVKVLYDCQRCTACCRWPGQVKLSEAEVSALAQFLNRSEFDFIQEFTRLRADRLGLSLIEKANGDCIFLEGNVCLVQAVKPQQCRDFPNGWNFPGFESLCKAVPRPLAKGPEQGELPV